jgi:hypothetical protein
MRQLARPRQSRTRTNAVVLVTAAVTAALAGCSAPSAGSGSTTASTPQSTTSSTASSTASSSALPAPSSPSVTSPAATPTAATSASACTGRQLRVGTGPVGAGAGQRYLPLVFTNVGTMTCTIYGYPGVAGLDSAGHQLSQARRESGWTKATITLAPGKAASSILHATVVPSGSSTCPPQYAALLVTPPNTTVSVRVTVPLPACGGLSVRPVVSGTTGL